MRIVISTGLVILFLAALGAVALLAPIPAATAGVLFWSATAGVFFGLACGLILSAGLAPRRV